MEIDRRWRCGALGVCCLWASMVVRPGEAIAAGSSVKVRFTADNPNAMLEAHTTDASGDRQWRELCVAPCEPVVPSGVALRVHGEGIYPSDPFYPPQGQVVMVHADTATRSQRVWGAILSIGGGIIFVNGAGLALVGAVAENAPGLSDKGDGLLVAGVVTMGVGAAIGIVGLVQLVGSKTTTEVSGLPNNERRLHLGGGFELSSAGLHF